ncbi:MAG: SpoIIE family protein phosphatase [Candidatus Delongbacteria bacterium]|nr:SpoIIE family protein phosphatase [Candidatus Delongbacteria bacterium]
MKNKVFTDIGHFQKQKNGQNSFGDVILKKHITQENRKIAVLSDGMGSGIKANVLAGLTASMAINFIAEYKNISDASELIMNILPECSERKVSYSTFFIADIEDGKNVNMIVYDSPLPVIIREGDLFDPGWDYTELTSENHKGKRIYTATLKPVRGDRIIGFTDGISQSGLGFGGEWGRDGAEKYILKTLSDDPDISAANLSEKLVNKSEMNDRFTLKDDASAITIHFREPRELLICSGAPVSKEKDFAYAQEFKNFSGKRIIAGGTTSEIIARELELKFKDKMYSLNDGLPPISILENVDLVTEGVMTLSRAERILRDDSLDPVKDGAAERIVRHILNSDSIKFLTGGSSNEYHFDLQYKMRIQLIKDIAELLERKYLKKTEIKFF